MTSQRRKLERRKKKRDDGSRSPRVSDVELSELKAIVERAKTGALVDADVAKLASAVDTLAFLTQELEAKGASIRRLRRWLFGSSSEKTRRVVGTDGSAASGAEPGNPGSDDPTASSENAETGEPAPASSASDDVPSKDASADESSSRRKGHGRNPAAAYAGAETVAVPHDCLQPKQTFPECRRGKLYRLDPPAKLVRIRGMAPLSATVYELERLRCNLCGEVFTAPAPEGVGDDKYDETASSMIALLKYGTGVPFNRIERLEAGFGIPLPASTQWEVVRDGASRCEAAYDELVRQAAHARVLHNDDTAMRVLELDRPERRQQLDADGDFEGRTGVFTTAIVATEEERQIALFFTGMKHAGENLSDLLAQRSAELSPPIQMCDALSRNVPSEFETVLANCSAHCRRNFVDVVGSFPDEVRRVLETYEQVYRNERVTKTREMSDDERLRFHQAESAPLLEDLEKWFDELVEQRKIEPNGGFGNAIAYATKHWDALTLFLRVPGAPIDNNLCERVLKKAILHRKNALFYKTLNGARVGDLFMTLIHTAELARIDAFDYLVALQRHRECVAESPADWMPWNYAETLDGLGDTAASD